MIVDARYLEMLWQSYRQEPAKLSADWVNAFQFIETIYGDPYGELALGVAGTAAPSEDGAGAYLRRFGHLHAALDPLHVVPPAPLPSNVDDPLADLYGGTVAVESGHVDSPEIADWIEQAFEAIRRRPSAPTSATYQRLIETETLDQFLATKYPGKKRFGSEGADAILPLLHHLRQMAATGGIDEIVVGSMHRGRLSIMANFLGLDPGLLFARIKGAHPFRDQADLAGDMPYHFGQVIDWGSVRCTLLPNPSHLEAVNPVATGYARARRAGGSGRTLALILHTDASVVGQGVNAELLQMSALTGFEVGGTIHIVINNQVGFTTAPAEARSSHYCTGPWRAIDSLIVHANGDDVDGVLDAGTLALDFRNRFARDAVIDLVCYRANGHNEIDEPRFTQPLYYQAADAKEGVVLRYERQLIAAALLTDAEAVTRRAAVRAALDRAFVGAEPAEAPPRHVNPRAAATALSLDTLHDMIERLSSVPPGRGHPKMIGLMERRREEATNGVSWALAETMAFAAALADGVSVRFCGQDIERGSFSQRHLAAIDPATGARHHVLRDFARDGATLDIVNSPLSEYAVLGFEYGYSLAAFGSLCIWEAQFGDFANGAQIVIDQFITSGYEKWQQVSALTVLLPHGLEGQGPEHSSARIERLLQLCANDNIIVAHPSTPANYFHLLRRQATGDRPLFVITPKVLLRLPEARSAITDFGAGSGFMPVIAAPGAKGARAILCSGKIAYEVERESAARGIDAYVIRLESLYPFPAEQLTETLADTGAGILLWLQEEPENFGAGAWLAPRLIALAAVSGVTLAPMVARPASASPAGSFHSHHQRDQHRLVLRALGLELPRGRDDE